MLFELTFCEKRPAIVAIQEETHSKKEKKTSYSTLDHISLPRSITVNLTIVIVVVVVVGYFQVTFIQLTQILLQKC